ncbi:hypothetical protein H6P81_013630 [Aristolochia fimbriata]|uniref:Ribosome maturation factor RimM n=1 Tax=Aristolochia fimbriata TaxID=158543 RepID=A0AAV7EF88_ARIFI|nr:hypothetical protein H6P81_013630 [Aristolochia fimbriata]
MRHFSFHASPTSFSSIPTHSCTASSSIFTKPPAIQSTPWMKMHFSCSLLSRRSVSSPLRTTAELHSVVEGEGAPEESEFIEIGYICNVHGLQGELRVKPTTDFPELRFSTPGKRWLRVRILGKERIQEVELTEGRGHPGQKNWIISLGGVDTVETARQFVGSTLLVRESDRPVLEEGEFYIPDLVGMKVILEETGSPVGTVVNVFNSGASDLLQVMLNPAKETNDLLKNEVTGPLVWIPFVEAIVPDVDMNKRQMRITPPEGLLELNIRSDGRSKKERHKLEWKQRKKMQQRLVAAKKKLNEIDQHHILQGLSFGGKDQKASLASQIASVNFTLLQQAMQSLHRPPSRYSLTEFVNTNWTSLSKGAVRISKESLACYESKGKLDIIGGRGAQLMSTGKVAIVLVISDKDVDSCSENIYSQFQAFLEEVVSEVKEWCTTLPLLLVCPSNKIQDFQQLFTDHSHYGFDAEKVWFLEEEKLPVFSSSLTGGNIRKILLGSPWLILQSPVGSGGVVSLLKSHNMVTNLSDMGIEYVEVCTLGRRSKLGNPYFFGLVESCNADVGLKIFDEETDNDDAFDMIFSMPFLKKITDRIDNYEFFPVPVVSSYVEVQGKEWIDVRGTSPNSYKLQCSINSFLKACSPDRISLVQIAE